MPEKADWIRKDKNQQMEFQFNNTILFTNRLKLRPLSKDDAQDMFEYTSQQASTKYLSWDPHSNIGRTISFLEELESKYGSIHSEFSWGIELKETGKMIGVVKLFDISSASRRAEVSYILNSNFQGKGYINEAIAAVIEFCFSEMKLIRVQARCSTDNIASEKVMQKAQMSFEGILKKYWILKGEIKDVALYAITNTNS
jgi:ribosomal-protein-alanine N-acetyltransferase